MDVILASKSPRRRELLGRLCREFAVIPSEFDEAKISEPDPVRFALAAAEAKARDIGAKHPEALVIGADTVVVLDRIIFGKPSHRAEAEAMLGRLAGRKHKVITGVALFRKAEEKLIADREISYVSFRPLGAAEISAYLDAHEVLDKAGSYAIQDIGEAFVEKLEGDYDNVVGFPVRRVARMLREFRAPELRIAVEDMDMARGWGFGLADGNPVLVPGAVPGDVVLGRLLWKKPLAAKIVRIETLSPRRVDPPCPHFGTCGGCAFQNLDYGEQLRLKADHYEQTVRRKSGLRLEQIGFDPILPSPDLFGYRNKMEFAFGGEAGALRLGLRARSRPGRKTFKRTVPLDRCLIFGKAAEEIFPLTREFADATGFPPYDPMAQRGYFRNLVLREGKATGEVMVLLVTRSGAEIDGRAWADRLMAGIPRVKSVWHVENDRVADLVDFEKARLLCGTPFIEEEIDGLRFRIHPESFFQPNPLAARLFYEKIAAWAEISGVRRALGLFCGPGAIELFLARKGIAVIGIDSEAYNIRDAEENAALNGIAGIRFVRGLVEKDVESSLFRGYDLIVLDPPREGLRPDGLTRVLELRPPRVAYMSCNPTTLARDLGLLAAGGLRPERIFGADFFPHTPHMEGLAFLTRIGAK